MSNFAQFSGFAGGGSGGAPVGAVTDVFGNGADANGWLIRNRRILAKSSYPNLFTDLGQRPLILPSQVSQVYNIASPPPDILRGLAGRVDATGVTIAWSDSANAVRGAWSTDGVVFNTVAPLTWGLQTTLRMNSTQKKAIGFEFAVGTYTQLALWNGGGAWSAISMPSAVIQADYNGNVIATFLNAAPSPRFFYVSKDNGTTWENWGSPGASPGSVPSYVWVTGGYVWCCFSPNDSTPGPVYYSNNGTWNSLGISTLKLFRAGDTIWGVTGDAKGFYVHASTPTIAKSFDFTGTNATFNGCQTTDGLITGYLVQPQSDGALAGIYQTSVGGDLTRVGVGPTVSGAYIGTQGWPGPLYTSGRQIASSDGFYAGQTVRFGLNGSDSNIAASSGGIGASGQAPLVMGALGGAFYAVVPNGVFKIQYYNPATQFQIPGQDPVGVEPAVPAGYTRMLMGG